MLVYVIGEGCQEQNQASHRDTAVARGGGRVSTCTLRERSPTASLRDILAFGVGGFFLGQD